MICFPKFERFGGLKKHTKMNVFLVKYKKNMFIFYLQKIPKYILRIQSGDPIVVFEQKIRFFVHKNHVINGLFLDIPLISGRNTVKNIQCFYDLSKIIQMAIIVVYLEIEG